MSGTLKLNVRVRVRGGAVLRGSGGFEIITTKAVGRYAYVEGRVVGRVTLARLGACREDPVWQVVFPGSDKLVEFWSEELEII